MGSTNTLKANIVGIEGGSMAELVNALICGSGGRSFKFWHEQFVTEKFLGINETD
jgi:hypothetical protein